MMQDVIVGIDSSTQSTKAVAWTRDGEALAEGRCPIAMSTPQTGWFEQDAEDWWASACKALKQVTKQIDPARIAGVAISNQRETVAFLDSDGKAVRPCIVWLDERAIDQLSYLCSAVGAELLHDITGKPIDITPVIYRLSWFKYHQPSILKNSAKIVDVHGFLSGRLTGTYTASWTSADPFGLLDISAKKWSAKILSAVGLLPSQLATLARPGSMIGKLIPEAAKSTGLMTGTPLFAAGGDGQCAGLGVNAVREGVIYLNLGTAVITGTWSSNSLISLNWRTMTSPTSKGYFLEGCQRAGTYLIDWFVDNFAGGRNNPTIFELLENEAAALPIGSDGVTVCPYLSGCMDPHWDPSAKASINGLAARHGQNHIYRAILEAIVLESVRTINKFRDHGLNPQKIIAVGGGGASKFWTQMFADAAKLPLHISRSLEASALGAGMSAAVGLGWFDSFDNAATAMSGEGPAIKPDPTTTAEWELLSDRQAAIYQSTQTQR